MWGAGFGDGKLTVEEGDNVSISRVEEIGGTKEIGGQREERELKGGNREQS